uniref:RNA-directed DNA polymerase, eukaryota, reverse transcriptase zinc-binding domain protein n=1 Tax=Tanacetum cinerariifolium TaxID=118510 RepID=A0A6L2J3M1_TANCI|nr:RNA-directed DNA polymerase, eukaryota, reverse transcriptase zinc-binding domain protein [Tanacetum cinerariifolium]
MMRCGDAHDNLFAYIDYIVSRPIGKSIWSIIQRLVLGSTIYYIWIERNNRLFQRHSRSVDDICSIIKDYVRYRLMSLKIKKSKQSLMAAKIWGFQVMYDNVSKDPSVNDDAEYSLQVLGYSELCDLSMEMQGHMDYVEAVVSSSMVIEIYSSYSYVTDEGLSIEERTLLCLEAQDRVKVKPRSFLVSEPKFLIKMPPKRNNNIYDVYERIMARIEERLDQFVDQFTNQMNDMMNPRRRGDRNGRRSEDKESKNPFFEGDNSSLFVERKEWEDDRVVDDDYEEGLVFDDDPYEEEIVSGDVGVNLVFKDELEMGDDVFVLIGEEVVEGSEIPDAMFPLLEEFSDVFPDEMSPGEHEELRRQKVQDFVEGLPYHGDSFDDDLVGNSRTNFVYPWGNDEGLSIEERALLFLEAQDRVKVKPRSFVMHSQSQSQNNKL